MRAHCLPHANVVVRVNGEALNEHQTENEALTATTFIEAVPGAIFDLSLLLDPGFAYRRPHDRIVFKVLVDGQHIESVAACPPVQTTSTTTMSGLITRKPEGSTMQRLTFAEHTPS